MAITQEFNLNMIPDSAPVVVHVNQYDEGEDRLVIHLLDGMVPYVPSTGAEAIIQGTKPDGKGFDYNATLSGSTVTANVTKQMTAVCGDVRTQIVITEGDNITGTFVFILAVQKSGLPADTDMSVSEYQVVMQLLETAEGINNNPPKIGANGHWWVWDASTGAYVDSGVDASISVEIADITMLEPDATPYVENTGTDTDPIFHLFIPRGQTGNGISTISKTGTSGYVDTYTVTYTDGSTSQFEITNGRNTDQVTTIPTASAALVDTIYQYIGESTSSYTHGFYYECVNDGGVYKWVNIPVGNDPVEVSNSDPYTYRQGKGNLADIKIEGASVGWNQLVQNGNFTSTDGWTAARCSLTASNNVLEITDSGDGDSYVSQNLHTGINQHKYYVTGDVKQDESGTMVLRIFSKQIGTSTVIGSFVNMSKVIEHSGSATTLYFDPTGKASGNKMYLKNIQVLDLTLMFGSTIADHIYSLEQAQAGAGVAFFRKYFSKDYYAYDAGSIQSACVGSRKVVGKNLLNPNNLENGKTVDASGNVIANERRVATNDIIDVSCFENVVVSCKLNITGANLQFMYALYDGDTFISRVIDKTSGTVINTSNATGLRLCFYASNYVITKNNLYDLQLELGSTATSYEPYTSTAYPFDSTKEIRGMFDLVNGELKASGDVWRGDKIQRNWAILSNQTGAIGDTITLTGLKTNGNIICSAGLISEVGTISGTTLTLTKAISGADFVYEKATPTTEAAQPYQNPQRAYIDGTEEFTDGLTRDVMIPVGNNTVYQQDKILPSVEDYVDAVAEPKADISAIGTNETGSTASQAYSIGQHFYKDGKFCTVIANIASGGTFTQNTNYVEGTIAQAIEAIQSASARIDIDPSAATIAAYPVGTMYLVTQ